MKCKLLLRLAVVMSLTVTVAVESSGAEAPPADEAYQTVTRVYDIRDLTLLLHDYPLGGALVRPTAIGQQSTDTPAEPPKAGAHGQPRTYQEAVNSVIKLIEQVVATESWKDTGGALGSMYELNGQLIVTQTPTNLKSVEALLSQLRSTRGAMVRIRADWVLLKPGQVGDLLKNGPEDKSALPEINRTALDKGADHAAHYAANLTCFNGQTVHVASGRAISTVTTRDPVVGTGVVAYDAKSEIVQYGVSLQVMPVIAGDGASATLDLLSESSEAQDAPRSGPATQPADANENGLDRLNAIVQHFHTTVQVPLNKPVLVEGMTAEPTVTQPQGDQWYLIIEADAGK
jgi:type II secretory pathway component GspD/PulD (secretin)